MGTAPAWPVSGLTCRRVSVGTLSGGRRRPLMRGRPATRSRFGEAGLRSLSALAGVATVPVAYVAARTLVCARVGVIAAALTACNPLLIWYSQDARSYSLLVLLTAL